MSTSYTDIVSKIKSSQQSYECSLRFWRARNSYLLDLPGGQGTAKPVPKRAVKRRKAHSMRPGNEKGGNGKGWQKSRKI